MDKMELAKKIIDLDFYGARDAGETAESIAEKIKSDPESIIKFLIDFIYENMEV